MRAADRDGAAACSADRDHLRYVRVRLTDV